jgi:hypothetical protein
MLHEANPLGPLAALCVPAIAATLPKIPNKRIDPTLTALKSWVNQGR